MQRELHLQRAVKAWPILAQAARGGRLLTYGELSAKIGVHHRAASWYLGIIQRFCAKKGLPRLQALAVNKENRVPGRGYAGARGRRAHAKEVERVKAHVWPKEAPFRRSKP